MRAFKGTLMGTSGCLGRHSSERMRIRYNLNPQRWSTMIQKWGWACTQRQPSSIIRKVIQSRMLVFLGHGLPGIVQPPLASVGLHLVQPPGRR